MKASDIPNLLNPFDKLSSNYIAKQVWFWAFCGAMLFAIVSPYLTLKASRTKTKTIIIDKQGNILLSNIQEFDDNKQMQAYFSSLATLYLFDRGPAGSNWQYIFDKLFTVQGKKKAEEIVKSNQQTFMDRKIQQKVRPKEFDIIGVGQIQGYDFYKIRVTAYLDREMNFNEQFHQEYLKITFNLLLLRNEDMITNQMLPLICEDISDYTETPLSSSFVDTQTVPQNPSQVKQ